MLIISIIISLMIFYPALLSFFTHDDFYFLKISKVENASQFISFFDPINDIQNIGVYRPLPLRVYYFLGTYIFNLNPLGLRIISFLTFFINILLVGYLTEIIIKKKNAPAIASFLYAVSVTHFGQLYYIGAYQELLITFFTLLSVISFAKTKIITSFIFFIAALMCKETAVVIPGLIASLYLFQNLTNKKKYNFKKLFLLLTPFVLIVFLYLYFHFFHFGTIEGDSYVWDFSPIRAINTALWYILWSLNLPEMLVDFVGPGIRFNPNLFKYWSKEIIPIFVLFVLQIFIICYVFLKSINKKLLPFTYHLLTFSILWFLLTILPVLFLPLHKFTYYLTLPLVGVVLLFTYIIHNSRFLILFCFVWLTLSLFSLELTINTNWITQGVEISNRVYTYFKNNSVGMEGKTISFIDTPEDKNLPWSPTETVKTVISDKNFFDLYFPDISNNISYNGEGEIKINSRQFLGY